VPTANVKSNNRLTLKRLHQPPSHAHFHPKTSMIFGWLKNRRRKKILAQPFPESWALHFNRNVRLSWDLPPETLAKLQQLTKVFVAEKHWEGCEGLDVTEEMQVTIAAQACLMLLGVDDFYFDNVPTVLVYPKTFSRDVPPRRRSLARRTDRAGLE